MKTEAIVVNGTLDRVEQRSTEVVQKTGRRTFSAEYIKAILQELDTCKHGESGRILRREGLYSKQVAQWRKQRNSVVAVPKRGPKATMSPDTKQELARLTRENGRLQRKLEHAELIIEVQKKVSQLLGVTELQDEER